MLLPEMKWNKLAHLTWADLEDQFWGGAGIRHELSVELVVTGTVERIGAVAFEIQTDIMVANVAGRVNYYDIMVHLLPDYERESVVNKAALRGAAAIFSYVESSLAQIESEQYLDTAVEAIPRWESMLRLVPGTANMATRREGIRTLLWTLKGSIREADLKAITRVHLKTELEIKRNETHGDYVFAFAHINRRTQGFEFFHLILERILNAGYTWDYEFTQNVWQDVEHLTWHDVSNLTWAQLENEEPPGRG